MPAGAALFCVWRPLPWTVPSPYIAFMNRTPADRPEHPRASERFNEEAATTTVQGGGEAPDLEKGVAAIRNVVRTLPVRPTT